MWITIDKDSNVPLMRQVYGQIKKLILNGSIVSGEILPPSRTMAKELQISRNTILEAYEQLTAEGFLVGKQGSKTVVAEGIPVYPLIQSKAVNSITYDHSSVDSDIIDFRTGIPDLSLFPQKEWGKLYQQIISELPNKTLRYNEPEGVPALRNTLSGYLFRTRGIPCDPRNIMIVSGSTQGLSLLSKILNKNKPEVLMEDPTHPGLRNVISSMGYKIIGIPADEKGLNTDLLIPSDSVSFLYVTPSHQYPLGGVLPIQRRLALIQYAIENDCYIVEDDYDSEFRYEGQPVHSLYELNPQRVIYLGSFSKILAPALRLGYILLPDSLLAAYKPTKKYADVHTEIFSQYVLSTFINNGGMDKYIWKMKKTYNKKREYLIVELSRHFLNQFEIKGQAAGLHLLVHFYHITFTKEIIAKLLLNKVKVYPVYDYEFQNFGLHNNEILLGYAHLTLEEISEGVRILSSVLYD